MKHAQGILLATESLDLATESLRRRAHRAPLFGAPSCRAPSFAASSCFALAMGLLALFFSPAASAADKAVSPPQTSTAPKSSSYTTKSVDGVIVTTEVILDEATLAKHNNVSRNRHGDPPRPENSEAAGSSDIGSKNVSRNRQEKDPRPENRSTAKGSETGSKTATLLLLHTNDIHDIVAAPAKGPGGMAYLSGYIHGLKAKRPDVVALNAGDLLEKGDRMCIASKGEVSYRAFGATGHDVTIPGNHDFVYGLDKLLTNAQLSGVPMICAGIYDEKTNKPLFPETFEKKFGNVRVGVIGATIDNVVRRNNRNANAPTYKQLTGAGASTELAEHINRLAKELEPRVDLTVLVVHNGLWMGKKLANAAPMIDVVITGHTNEVTPEPVKSNTGAIVLAVGRAGKWVGTMDMVVDLEGKRIAKYTYQMTPMDHAQVKPDEKLAAQIGQWDKQWADVPLPPRPKRGTAGKTPATAAPKQ